jgi:hypothetical protein
MPAVRASNSGLIPARALEQAGATGVQIGLQMQADQARLQAEQTRQDLAEQRAAETAAATRELGEGTLRLRTEAQTLAERVLAGEVKEEDARNALTMAGNDVMNQHGERVSKSLRPAVVDPLRLKVAELAESVLRPAARQRVRDETKANVLSSLELFEREATEDRPRNVARATALVQSLGPAAGLGPDDQFRVIQQFRERTAYTQAEGLLNEAGRDIARLDAAAKVLTSEAFADLSPDARQRLDVQITNRRAQAEHAQIVAAQRAAAAAERRQRDAEAAAKSLTMLIDGGAVPSDQFLGQVQQATSGTVFAPVVQAAVQQAAERAGFGSLLPDQQRQQILALRTRLTAQGSTPALEQRLARLEDMAASSAKKAKDEPLQWAADTRLLPDVQPLQFGDVNSLAGQLVDRIGQAATVGAALRRPVSPLMGFEATRLGEMLGSLPWSQKAGALRAIGQRIPPEQQRALAEQLAGGDQSLALAMYASTAPSPAGVDLPALILRGADAERSGRIKRDDAAVTADRTRIARELAAVAWATPQAREAAIAASMLTYQGLRDQRNGGSAGWRDAIRLATGDLVEIGAGKVPAPPGWDERRFKNAIRNTDAKALQGQMRGPVFVNGQPVAAESLARALSTATFIPMAPGQYALDVGGLVLTADRRPWVYTVRDF